jgi:serine/threonine protein kinase
VAKTHVPGDESGEDGEPEQARGELSGAVVLNQHAWEGPGYLLGQVLGDRYRILDIIGEGGMGVVYLGEHVTLQRQLAVKVLHPELCRDSSLIDRFLQEARAASKIGHPSIVDIIDFGWMHRGSVYFVMEYLEGEDLSSLLQRERRVPWRRARTFTLQIARALKASHRMGVIHRDLKPANCFLTHRDGEDFVKLLDFGIAKMNDPSRYDPPVVTRGGSVFGTPGYMAPEQASGEPSDQRTDVYATAACLYEFLTGAPPYIGNNFMQVVSRVLTTPLMPPTMRAPDNVPPVVEEVMLKALAKDPDERYQTMAEFEAAIDALHPDLQPQIGSGAGRGAPARSVEDVSTPSFLKAQTVVPFRKSGRRAIPSPPPFEPHLSDEEGSELVLETRPPIDDDRVEEVTRSDTAPSNMRVDLGPPPSHTETQPRAHSPFVSRTGDTDVAQFNPTTGEIISQKVRAAERPRRDTELSPLARRLTQRATEVATGAPKSPESIRPTLPGEELDEAHADAQGKPPPSSSIPQPSAPAGRSRLRDTQVAIEPLSPSEESKPGEQVRTGQTWVTGEQVFFPPPPLPAAPRHKADGQPVPTGQTPAGKARESTLETPGGPAEGQPRNRLRDTQVTPVDAMPLRPDPRAGTPPPATPEKRGRNRSDPRVERPPRRQPLDYSPAAVAAAAAESTDQFQSGPQRQAVADDDWDLDDLTVPGSRQKWILGGILVGGLLAAAMLFVGLGGGDPAAAPSPTEVEEATPTIPDASQEPALTPSAAPDESAAEHELPGEALVPVPAEAAQAPEGGDAPTPARQARRKRAAAAPTAVLGGAEVAAGFKSSRKRIRDECGRHPGTRVKIQATVSGAGFVVSARPAPGETSSLARCVAETVERSAKFAAFTKKSDTFLWTYRL